MLRVRQYVTVLPTTVAHDGDESDFVGLVSVVTGVASIVSPAAWCRGLGPVSSMLEGSPTEECGAGMLSFLGALPMFTGQVLFVGRRSTQHGHACMWGIRVRRRQHRAHLRIVWTVALSLVSGTCVPVCACWT